jgi:hypothetical protein
LKTITIHLPSALVGAGALGALLLLTSQSPPGPGHDGQHGQANILRELQRHASVVYLEDGQGGFAKTIRFSGVNVQVVNGLRATNGLPGDDASTDDIATRTNGLGNLIVGYNEPGNADGDDRTGSHNIVVGTRNTYASYGGLVASSCNSVLAPYASVSGGGADPAVNQARGNVVSARWSSISGGNDNDATSEFASISGGEGNLCSDRYASCSGGRSNMASGRWTSVSGGENNEAQMSWSSVTGGLFNVATGRHSSVAGGRGNAADGAASSVSGGLNRIVSQINSSGSLANDWIGGSLWEDQ